MTAYNETSTTAGNPGGMETRDYRIRAARNFLATAPATDFTKLLAGVVDVAEDYEEMDLDQNVSQILDEGGVYLAPADFLHLSPACQNEVNKIVTMKT
jgi:hypothetical protein